MKQNLRIGLLWLWYSKEAWIWIIALVLLATSNPSGEHYSFCVFHRLGIPFCPGCGIGRSITLFFHGQFESSFLRHPLGIPAVIMLSYRIFTILKKSIQQSEIINPSSV